LVVVVVVLLLWQQQNNQAIKWGSKGLRNLTPPQRECVRFERRTTGNNTNEQAPTTG
jgi:hypothetical protein